MKKFSFYLLCTMLFVVLAACSDDTQTPAEPVVTEEGSTVIKVVFKDDGPSNPAAVKFYDTLAEKLKADKGIDVEFELVEVAQGTYSEKLNLLLYSGEIPDLIYFQGGDEQIASQDLLEDLTPYIAESEYLKAILMPHNETRLANYPYLLWVKGIDNKVPVVRTDFLEQTSSGAALLADPTPDNYKAFFQELVDKGFVKNGVTVAGAITELDFVFNMAFGETSTWIDNGSGYVYSKVSEAEKNKLAYYSELYAAGLLDNQYLTKQWDTKEDAFYNNETGVIIGTNGKVIDFYNSRQKEVNGESAELTVLPPAKGIGQGYGATSVTKETRGLAISSQSPNKELVFDILDYLASPAGMQFDMFGFEGEQYNTVNGEIELTDKYYAEWYARYWEPANPALEVAVSKSTPVLSAAGVASKDAVSQFYTQDNNFSLPEEYIAQWDAMENLYKEYSADIITGKKSIDAFDEFVQKWNEAGGEAITQLANDTIK
ncbi:extracellular solute-binding protein [Solibacillus sp. FSL H8-0538]|uniref:extracellular solute-binding protein n=1 Tax=Solibacillus sp. FSL H8-0538 TaxID=2921400 RepID=UPI0030F63253